MGTEAFKAEYAAGRTLTSEQIIDLALGTRARYRSLRCTSRPIRSSIDTTRPSAPESITLASRFVLNSAPIAQFGVAQGRRR
jgi:hypothetical protein